MLNLITGRRVGLTYIALITLFCFVIMLIPSFPAGYNVEAGAIADLFGIQDDTGGFISDNTFDATAGKLCEYADEAGNIYITAGQSENVIRYIPARSVELVNQGNRILNLSNGLKVGGQVLNLYNSGVDTYKLFTENSKQETFIEKGIDKGLLAIDVGMGWYAAGAGAVAIFTAPAWGAGIVAAATVTGTAFLLTKLGVGAARVAFNSETYREASKFVRNSVTGAYGLVTGKKKLVFAPYQRPGMKEALKIIEDELGFELYPGLRREIPDPATGIPVYKPNIYLYSDTDLKVNVKVYPEHWITESEPLYRVGKGWEADIANGSLNGREDYLFYEAVVPDEGFQKEYGWKINSETRAKDIMFILGKYGFSEKEISDFIEYWIGKLETDRDYIFYPQVNKEIDEIMPVIVSEIPDHIFRLWFYIVPSEEIDKQKLIIFEPANIQRIKRQGFYMVEWGGVLKNPVLYEKQ